MTNDHLGSYQFHCAAPAMPLLAIFLAFCIAVALSSPAIAQVKRCECDFADPQWQAFGTKGACSTWMDEGQKSCEVEFGGYGAEPAMISLVLGREAMDYYAEVSEIVRAYLEFRIKEDPELTSPEFIQRALPALMRGAFLRGSPVDATLNTWRDLNTAIEKYVEAYSDEISGVFRGEIDALEHSGKDIGFPSVSFYAGRGYIVVDIEDAEVRGRLVTVYLPQE